MPQNARILQLEDNEYFAIDVETALRKKGHDVETIGTLYEFESYLENKPPIDVALIDNHVPWEPGEEADYKPQGAIAESWIREKWGNEVIVIATTNDTNPGYGDHHVPQL